MNKIIQNGETSLDVTILPLQNAETIILLHGGPGVPYSMKQVGNLLHEKYQIIYFDQRGTGNSLCENRSYKIEDYISDIDRIIEFFEIEKCHLFGHSWGGLYAQIYSEANPSEIDSLFLCSPSSGTNNTWSVMEKEVMQFNKRTASNSEWLKMGWNSLLGMFGSDIAYRKLFIQVYKNYHNDHLDFKIDKSEIDKIFADPVNITRKEIINYKPLPILENPSFAIGISYGEKDVYGKSKRKLIERYPTAEVFNIKNSGHIPWLHNPDEFKKIMIHFYNL